MHAIQKSTELDCVQCIWLSFQTPKLQTKWKVTQMDTNDFPSNDNNKIKMF